MPSIHSLLVFTLAAAAMNISPGPSNLYVMSRSLAQGARAGLVAAFGLATGSLFHVAATALGLSVVLRYSPTLYAAVKLVGAGYLIFLGLRLLLSKGAALAAAPSDSRRSHGRIFRESILVEMLNPKTALFFLAFLPQFADPSAGPLAPQLLLLGGIVTLTAIPCDAFVALAAGAAASALARRPLYGRLQKWLSGSILVSLGAYVAASERP
jgi:threonine/homoserine/homoserine lactone efflux protein